MRTTKLFSIAVTFIAVFVFSQSSVAQLADFYTSPGYSTYINDLITNHRTNLAMERHTNSGNRASQGTSRSTSSTSTSYPEVVPAYRRYPAVQFRPTGTRLTLHKYLDSVNVSAKDKAELKELVLGIFREYETEAARKGYPNDWALAFVSYIGLNSHVYNGRTGKPSLPFEQNIGMRDVAAEYATDHGIFNNVTDRTKQELYELLIITGGLTYHFYEKALASNNVEELKNCRLQAATNLKLIGIKP